MDSVEERVDMVLSIPGWLEMFPYVVFSNLVAPMSDHTSIFLKPILEEP